MCILNITLTISKSMDFIKICQNTEKEMRKELKTLKKEIAVSLKSTLAKPKVRNSSSHTEKLESIL